MIPSCLVSQRYLILFNWNCSVDFILSFKMKFWLSGILPYTTKCLHFCFYIWYIFQAFLFFLSDYFLIRFLWEKWIKLFGFIIKFNLMRKPRRGNVSNKVQLTAFIIIKFELGFYYVCQLIKNPPWERLWWSVTKTFCKFL